MACLLDQMDIHSDCSFLLSWVVFSGDGAAKFLVVHGGLYGFEFGKRFLWCKLSDTRVLIRLKTLCPQQTRRCMSGVRRVSRTHEK